VFEVLASLQPSWRGTVDLREALGRVREGAARIERRSAGGWRCSGSAEDLLIGNRFVLGHMGITSRREAGPDSPLGAGVLIDPTARVESSVLRGPSVIGPGARVVDCYVGPYSSIGPGVHAEGSEIEDSIILSGATITNLGRRLEASIVGRGAHLSRDFTLPSVLRMRVGERAEVALA
jgi:glucose-1-phosphate thymidylyltransferase